MLSPGKMWPYSATCFALMTMVSLLAARQATAELSFGSGPPASKGDFLSMGQFDFWSSYHGVDGVADFPWPGRVKVANNNSPMPRDRFYFVYERFPHALDSAIVDTNFTPIVARDRSLDLYTAGVEKTFGGGLWSVELRLPFTNAGDASFDQGFSTDRGQLWNLSIIGKRLLYQSETTAIAAGVGLSAPIADDTQFIVRNEVYSVNHNALHLLPFVGMVVSPSDPFFIQSYIQVDVPTASNRVEVQDLNKGGAPTTVGFLTEQTLLYLSSSAGYWIYNNPDGMFLTGVAPMVEVHYTGTLQQVDVASGSTSYTDFNFRAAPRRFDVVNLTFGVHTEIGQRTALRVFGVVPMSGTDNRFFNSEFHMSLVRRF